MASEEVVSSSQAVAPAAPLRVGRVESRRVLGEQDPELLDRSSGEARVVERRSAGGVEDGADVGGERVLRGSGEEGLEEGERASAIADGKEDGEARLRVPLLDLRGGGGGRERAKESGGFVIFVALD